MLDSIHNSDSYPVDRHSDTLEPSFLYKYSKDEQVISIIERTVNDEPLAAQEEALADESNEIESQSEVESLSTIRTSKHDQTVQQQILDRVAEIVDTSMTRSRTQVS